MGYKNGDYVKIKEILQFTVFHLKVFSKVAI